MFLQFLGFTLIGFGWFAMLGAGVPTGTGMMVANLQMMNIGLGLMVTGGSLLVAGSVGSLKGVVRESLRTRASRSNEQAAPAPPPKRIEQENLTTDANGKTTYKGFVLNETPAGGISVEFPNGRMYFRDIGTACAYIDTTSWKT